MRKLLVMATMLSVVGGVAFAGGPAQPQGWIVAGDANLATTGAASNAGVASTQGTFAGANVKGTGAVLVGTVSGNYTQVTTGAGAAAGPAGSVTATNAQQENVGGTISGGLGLGGQPMGRGYATNGASGVTGGGQSSQAAGNAVATASNANLGGFLAIHPIGTSTKPR